MTKPPREFLIGPAYCSFGIGADMAAEIGNREQEIADGKAQSSQNSVRGPTDNPCPAYAKPP
jgi:hypothetical protein